MEGGGHTTKHWPSRVASGVWTSHGMLEPNQRDDELIQDLLN